MITSVQTYFQTMYIKRIVIQGFKSYKNETVINSFSPHHNVVVGRNGSGKSNFFAAIRFVLSDAYTSMTRQERQSLIHEGSSTVMSAYVEIVFDNKDRRLPVNKDEVRIRRTIGMQKDDYSLDGKSALKSDILNFLESADFSRSNPYYIVPQGRITAITNSKDSEKLDLLKDVAGAAVFEKKLKESNKEMNSANKKQEQIDEMLRYINTRLSDLSMEKENLKIFEKYNTTKKVLEFNLYDREIKSLTQQIDTVENNYSNILQDSSAIAEDLNDGELTIKNLEDTLAEYKSQRKLLEIEGNSNKQEIADLLSTIGSEKAELKSVELELASASGEDSLKLEHAKQELAEKSERIDEIHPKLKRLQRKSQEISSKLENMRLEQRSLLSKRGRGRQFKTQQQRDKWLQSEVDRLDSSLTEKNNMLASLQKSEIESQKQINALVIKKKEIDATASNDSESQVEKELYELKTKCTSLIDERKALWREESTLNSVLQTYKDEKSKIDEELNSIMSSSISKGLESVKHIVNSLSIEGVYGTLGELIDVSDKYKTAVEVIGGNALFNVIVDTDRTASLIMEQLTAQKSGRVTFMPLNRMNKRSVNYPHGSDFVPLMRKIAYDDSLETAVQHVFGNTVVAISLERGAEISKTTGLNAVTLDGDRCNHSGVLSGGFREQTKSRVDCLKSLNKWDSQISTIDEKLVDIKTRISEKDSAITKVNASVNQKRKEYDSILVEKDLKDAQITEVSGQLGICKQEIDTYGSRIKKLRSSIDLLNEQKHQYESEMQTDFESSKLSEAEEEKLAELQGGIPETQKQYDEISSELQNLEVDYSSLKSEINEMLIPLVARLTRVVSKSRVSDIHNKRVEDLKIKLEDDKKKKRKLEEEKKNIANKVDELEQNISDVEKHRKEADESQKTLIRKLAIYTKDTDKLLSKKVTLRTRRDELNKKVNDLGLLTDDAFTKYEDVASTKILEELTKVSEDLKQYSHVNRKALEQYINFSKQRDSLVSRRKELDNGKSSIEELMLVLQKRKNKAIIQTFKEVATKFSEVFQELVPAGTGSLILQKKNEKSIESLTQQIVDNDESADNSSDQYVGVSIVVSFNSKKDEQLRLEQLSGGQKSLCALALIFAIQKCDPAPFYLFDEIDANLDEQYRTAVAHLVHKLSAHAQFICTTFRKEMLDVSDKFYGVMFNNKVSTVAEISKKEAINFVGDLQVEHVGSIEA